MLQEVFYWIFNMSITATITGLLILPLRRIRRIPRRLAVLLWSIPFLRMAIPFGLDSPYSLMSLLSKLTTKTVVVYQPTEEVSFSMMNCIMAANTYFPITYKVALLEKVFGIASVVWMIVSLAVLLVLVVTYFSTMYELRDSVPFADRVYFSKKVLSPAIYGIVRPKIVLPESYRERDCSVVLLHEHTHIRSKDNLWRAMAFALVAVHWFNPFCWLFLKELLADLELACDERVLSALGADRAKEYATVLLESREGTTVFASAFGGAKIRTRIENILSFKKMTGLSLAVFLALLGIVFYVLLTNAA